MKKESGKFLKRLLSRKLILSVVSALVVFGNRYWNWGLSEQEVMAVVISLLTFVGVEGWADAKRAANE